MPASRFPELDAPRTSGTGRVIMDVFNDVEPYVELTDTFVSMPLRLVHNATAGFHIELGPYALDSDDIQRLREAFAAWEAAGG